MEGQEGAVVGTGARPALVRKAEGDPLNSGQTAGLGADHTITMDDFDIVAAEAT